LLSGVVIPMEVGEIRNWASYAFAAVTPELPEVPPPPPLPLLLLLLLLLLLPPPVLLLLLLLLLHAATPSAEVSAMTATRVFLIRASFPAGARSAERWSLNLVRSQLGVTESVINLGFRTTGCPYVACTEAKMLCAVPRGLEPATIRAANWGYLAHTSTQRARALIVPEARRRPGDPSCRRQ